MLNRHTIVLFLGSAALLSLRPLSESLGGGLTSIYFFARMMPLSVYGALGTAFMLVLLGLLLDNGHPGPRSRLGHLLQAAGVLLLAGDGALLLALGPQALHLAAAELGIALAVLGVLVEMLGQYRLLRAGVVLQVAGDLLYVAAFVLAVLHRESPISAVRWTFVVIAGALGLYAAVSNLVLQLARLKNPQAGWRYRVLGVDGSGLSIKTPAGAATVAWRHVQAVQRLDGRHLILILPSPLPPELAGTGLPVEELREAAEELPPGAPPPERYGFVLHEQELGRSLPEAESLVRSHVPSGA